MSPDKHATLVQSLGKITGKTATKTSLSNFLLALMHAFLVHERT
jgi:hypothetical protein